MQRFASVRFDGVLAPSECDAAARAVGSVGATATSWNVTEYRTYATLAFADSAPVMPAAWRAARIDEPPLLVLRIVPHIPIELAALAHAFGGPGAPSGIVDCYRCSESIVVECEPAATSLATLVALVDGFATPGRRIEPLVVLDDASLVALASYTLAEPDLEIARLIEPHLALARNLDA